MSYSGALTHFEKLAAAVGAALPTFFFAEGNSGPFYAAGFAGLAAIGAAFLASLPALVRERNASRARKEENQITFLKERIIFHSQKEVLVRQSKHNALDHLSECQAHIGRLRLILQDKGVTPPEFKFKYYDELCGDEDRAIALLTLPASVHSSMTPDIHHSRPPEGEGR